MITFFGTTMGNTSPFAVAESGPVASTLIVVPAGLPFGLSAFKNAMAWVIDLNAHPGAAPFPVAPPGVPPTGSTVYVLPEGSVQLVHVFPLQLGPPASAPSAPHVVSVEAAVEQQFPGTHVFVSEPVEAGQQMSALLGHEPSVFTVPLHAFATHCPAVLPVLLHIVCGVDCAL
jgi:hypothetical protein